MTRRCDRCGADFECLGAWLKHQLTVCRVEPPPPLHPDPPPLVLQVPPSLLKAQSQDCEEEHSSLAYSDSDDPGPESPLQPYEDEEEDGASTAQFKHDLGPCPDCGFIAPRPATYRRHLITPNACRQYRNKQEYAEYKAPDGRFQCPRCIYSSRHKSNFRKHYNSGTACLTGGVLTTDQSPADEPTPKYGPCKNCGYRTNALNHYTGHQKRPNACRLWKKRNELEEHRQDDGSLKCPRCAYSTVDLGRFREHIAKRRSCTAKVKPRRAPPNEFPRNKTALGELLYGPCGCGFSSRSLASFRHHVNTSAGCNKYSKMGGDTEEDRLLRCPNCPYTTPLRNTFRMHMANPAACRAQGEGLDRYRLPEGGFQCPTCAFATSLPSTFRAHMKGACTKPGLDFQPPPKTTTCPLCFAPFTRPEAMLNHLQDSHPPPHS